MKKLAKDWSTFGEALGLDPAEERERHQKAARNRCSWSECQYYREKPDNVGLSTCKGCGEVRYCGRECQRKYVDCPSTFGMVTDGRSETGQEVDTKRCAAKG